MRHLLSRRKDTPAPGSGNLPHGRPRTGLRASLALLARTRRSAMAVEFSLIAIPFFIIMLGTMELSYDMYLQASMYLIVNQASRLIWTGQAQGSMTSAAFVSNYICPYSGYLLACNQITVRVRPVRPLTTTDFWYFMNGPPVLPNYQTGSGRSGSLNTAGWTVCTGGPGDGVLVEAVYAAPTFIGGFIPSFIVSNAGQLVHPVYASNGFVNQIGITVTVSC